MICIVLFYLYAFQIVSPITAPKIMAPTNRYVNVCISHIIQQPLQ